MNHETVLFEKKGEIGIVRLNRPERMNAVIEQMYIDLQTVFEYIRKDNEIRAVLLTGSVRIKDGIEKQAFCAGADLKAHNKGERTGWQKRQYILLAHETTRLLYEFSKPVIAVVNGPARGAGAEMALNCDFVFMADDASIGFPETSLGTFIGGGVTYHLTQIIGMVKAKQLVYTGQVLNGKAATDMGLAFRSVPLKNLENEAMTFAKIIAEKAPISISFAKDQIQKATQRDLQTVLLTEAEAILACMNTEDWHEGIKSFAEKRKPIYKGR